MDYIIETIGLTKQFGNFIANDNIHLQVKKEEIKCIVGENGAGKSTMMNMLYGLLQPTSGKIFIRGKETILNNPLDAISHGIGMVHQHFKLVPSLTVYENILLGVEIHKKRGKIRTPFIDKKTAISIVENLIRENRFDLNPLDKIEDISVGARQRVEILKMLYRNVDILILDEPTAVLTPQEVDELMITLKNLKQQGKTIIIITHKLREVMELADSITVIKQGKVMGNVKKEDTNEKELAQMMVGRDISFQTERKRKKVQEAEKIYEVSNITTCNGQGKEVISNLSFHVRKGEILGVAGVEGNGQSELVKIMTGLMTVTKGNVQFLGENITNWWPRKLRKIGIGMIPEDRYAQGLCKDMTIGENCIAGYHDEKDICKYGLHSKSKISAKRDQYINDYNIRVGDVNGSISSLSGGNAQKVIIARELAAKPKLLIACQPTRGVDIGAIEFIHNQILKFKEEGNTVILISSELSEIMNLSDRVIVMYKGKIAGEVKVEETTTTEIGLLMAGITRKEGENEEK